MSKPLLRGGVNHIINKAVFLAGIDRKISPHQFRHFYGTYSTINGMDIWTLKELMGHSSISTTQRYIHVADRVSGNILKHMATSSVKVPRHTVGYSKILRELAEKTR
jgi:site-specific recombinase XerD